jgi:phosphatidylglycerol:prolipoprotein diacylglycerol transferase
MFSLHAVALAVPGFIRVGGLRLPVYGIFAAAGLIAALWLSQRTALRVGLSANRIWDAGVFAVIAAFVASRALLVAVDLRAFLKYPLLVLSLPSLTYGGMLLTGLMVWAWLRWKRMPVRDVLDAWVPCGALLAAVLSVAHYVEGTDAGMPTGLPWGVVTPGDTVLGRVHPVEIYAAVFALVLCVGLVARLPKRRFAGEVAALAMMVGGAGAFLLDMLRQPVESFGDAVLDPGQFVALGLMLVGVIMYREKREPRPELTRVEAAQILENLVAGRGENYDHEKIYYGAFSDPLLIELKMRFPDIYEGPRGGILSQEESDQILLDYALKLRSDGEQSKEELV